MTALGPPGAAQAAEADAPTIAGLKWLGGRLERRARDARQAEADARRLSPDGYPHASGADRGDPSPEYSGDAWPKDDEDTWRKT